MCAAKSERTRCNRRDARPKNAKKAMRNAMFPLCSDASAKMQMITLGKCKYKQIAAKRKRRGGTRSRTIADCHRHRLCAARTTLGNSRGECDPVTTASRDAEKRVKKAITSFPSFRRNCTRNLCALIYFKVKKQKISNGKTATLFCDQRDSLCLPPISFLKKTPKRIASKCCIYT